MSGEWAIIEPMEGEEAITDICLLAKKEKVPSGYAVIDLTVDGKKADFAEGSMFGSTKRYLAYTRKVPSALRGRLSLVDLKVILSNDRSPLGYLPLAHTHDDNTKAFSHKVLVMKVAPHEQATRAVRELQILSASRKEDVQLGFTRLPDINGFSICFKVGEVGRRNSAPTTKPAPVEAANKEGTTLARKVRSATDGLQFKLSAMVEKKQYLIQHAIGDLQMLSLEDFEEKYTVDFDKYRSYTNVT
jgi:hypothetical protein